MGSVLLRDQFFFFIHNEPNSWHCGLACGWGDTFGFSGGRGTFGGTDLVLLNLIGSALRTGNTASWSFKTCRSTHSNGAKSADMFRRYILLPNLCDACELTKDPKDPLEEQKKTESQWSKGLRTPHPSCFLNHQCLQVGDPTAVVSLSKDQRLQKGHWRTSSHVRGPNTSVFWLCLQTKALPQGSREWHSNSNPKHEIGHEPIPGDIATSPSGRETTPASLVSLSLYLKHSHGYKTYKLERTIHLNQHRSDGGPGLVLEHLFQQLP